MPGWLIWGGVFVLVFGSIFAMAYFGGGNGNGTTGTASLKDAVTEKDWIKGGGLKAPVILVEYGDFQCPACAAYHAFVEKLVSELGNQVSFVYRNFPLRTIHKNADLSAQAAEAAGKQGKFWEMYNLIFEHQKDWADDSAAREKFLAYAQSLNLDLANFKRDMDSSEVKDKIEGDFQSGLRSNIQGTPTFYINGNKINNPLSYDEFKKLIIEAQNAGPVAPKQNTSTDLDASSS